MKFAPNTPADIRRVVLRQVKRLHAGDDNLLNCHFAAQDAQRCLGRGVINYYDTVPTPPRIGSQYESGHTFLVVDARWLVDMWGPTNEGSPWATLDLQNQAEIVERYYGDPSTWQHDERISDTDGASSDCYRWVYQYLRRHPRATLVHGTVLHPWDKREILHAWIEDEGRVLDYQSAVMDRPFLSVAAFDQLWQPRETKRYSFDAALDLVARMKHYGPWRA